MFNAIPTAAVNAQDPNLSKDPILLFQGGVPIPTSLAMDSQEVNLPAATDDLALPYPPGVSTASFIAVFAAGTTDLVVGYGAEDLVLPKGQLMFFYNVPTGKVTLSSVLGGKVLFVVGA